jgi:L-methionine (R)-S-oxide reductase
MQIYYRLFFHLILIDTRGAGMADILSVPKGQSKDQIYQALLPQIESIFGASSDMIANMANGAAILSQAFNFHWVGFYRALKSDLLVLGPFQGPLACVEIPFSKGICGAAARMQKTIIVPDVENFPGHISCSALSKSEIVIPGVIAGKTVFVLDVDSVNLADFDDIDQKWLENIVSILIKYST